MIKFLQIDISSLIIMNSTWFKLLPRPSQKPELWRVGWVGQPCRMNCLITKWIRMNSIQAWIVTIHIKQDLKDLYVNAYNFNWSLDPLKVTLMCEWVSECVSHSVSKWVRERVTYRDVKPDERTYGRTDKAISRGWKAPKNNISKNF